METANNKYSKNFKKGSVLIIAMIMAAARAREKDRVSKS